MLLRTLATCFFLATALLAAPSARGDAKADILASHEAMVKFGKYRATGTVQSDKGTQQMSSIVVWPDRFHVNNAGQEFIIVPGATYMKQGGQWQKLPMDMSQMVKSMTPDALRQGYDNMTNVKDLGSETIDGRETRVYEYDTRATIMGIEATSHVKAWIDADSHLPVKQVVTGTAMGMTSTTDQRYEFDSAIEVDAPL